MSTSSSKPYVRVATLKDLNEVVKLAARAFVHDPVVNYFGNVPKLVDPELDLKQWERRHNFHYFLTKATFLIGGRVTVAVDPADNNKIVAGALWMPPKTRLARIVGEYQETSETMLKKCFQAKGTKGSPHDAWYLQMVFTDPDQQGRGLMSMLMREAFENAPDATFCLEATTENSRDKYTHLGFEHPIPIPLGVGKADSDGVRAQGKDASGFECYAMGRWPSK